MHWVTRARADTAENCLASWNCLAEVPPSYHIVLAALYSGQAHVAAHCYGQEKGLTQTLT
eukprot:m.299745 g.299745  ORF g.299745 m.299745 type:complete len:60 (-) comp27241_c0_seq8:16-195(-)